MGWTRAMLAAAIAAASGCDDGISTSVNNDGLDTAAGAGMYRCDRRVTTGICIEFRGEGWAADSRATTCGQDTVEPGNCPTSDLGGCGYFIGEPLERFDWYYVGAFYEADDGAQLSDQCTANVGTWY